MELRNLYRRAAMIAVGGLMAVGCQAASAAEVLTFNLATGNSPQIGTMGNVRTFTATDGVSKLEVSAYTAVSDGKGGYTLQSSYVGSYGNGLGVTSTLRDVDHQAHMVDNELGYDFLVFQFDKNVTVDLAQFNVFSVAGQGDSDATIGVGSTNVPFSGALNLTSWGDITSLFSNMHDNLGGSADAVRSLNPTKESGNLLFVAAGLFSKPNEVDNFKIASLTATAAVPEPASWAMMIGGFSLIGATMRRRTARVAFA
jgi:hypothetical protein